MLLARCSAQALADVKASCEGDLLAFTALFFRARMNMEFLVNWHHEYIADSLMAVYRGEVKNLCINMPPGGTKTELAVIHFMAWCLARDPYCRFLHLSGADDLAALNSATTKEIIELEEYQLLWPTDITVLMVMDTAQKVQERNDSSVLGYFGFDGHNVYVLDIDRGKWEAPDLLDHAVAFMGRHRPRRPSPVRLRGVLIEDKASGTGLIQSLKRHDAVRDIPVIAVQRNRDKVSRVNDVLSFIRAGQLWVPESAPWLNVYLGELASFSPAMTHMHDDQVDVTVDALDELLNSARGMSRGMDLS